MHELSYYFAENYPVHAEFTRILYRMLICTKGPLVCLHVVVS
jgi:hypothetical protein